MCRNEENGVQESPMARKVLCLFRLQDADWHQVVHPAGAGHLLLRLLRRKVCHSMREMYQGVKHVFLQIKTRNVFIHFYVDRLSLLEV